jgi:hypothetical protein
MTSELMLNEVREAIPLRLVSGSVHVTSLPAMPHH